jgi:hypothetical protein
MFQRTSQGLSDTNGCGEKHVNFPRFNSLNIADVQVGKFCGLLPAHAFRHALPADALSERRGF